MATVTAPIVALKKKAAVLYGLPALALLAGFWSLGVRFGWTLPLGIQMQFLPPPGEVAGRMWDVAVGGVHDDAYSGSLWRHLAASTLRVLNGFLLAAVFAIPLGVLMGRFAPVRRALETTVNLVRPIPVTAWAPLTLLIIGYGDRSTIFLIFVAAFFPILLNTTVGVAQVPPRLLEAAAMLGTPKAKTLYKIVIPSAMQSITSGLRIALGLSWVVLVVGETVGISTGLGAMITQARDMSRTDLIIAGMVFIGLAGFATDRFMGWLLRVATRGRPGLS
ncbi:NitT/TauT family transport system permease protein [Rhodococcus sp. OK519]|uniref:ABC transporter permease n=1 Tax=Rhodococcus sp. OK519 TaxID=2135729 RepID=UPI000D421D31|nr:NitT/TauT family transport system permease protein [Rhodococcus sp. OK519]